MDFEDLYKRIDDMSRAELDQLPYGIIKLDEQGVIVEYNQYESQLAGLAPARVLGRNFFTEVAPCTDVQEFHGRFREGVATQRLDVRFRYRFLFKPTPRDVLVTLHNSNATRAEWVLVQPVD